MTSNDVKLTAEHLALRLATCAHYLTQSIRNVQWQVTEGMHAGDPELQQFRAESEERHAVNIARQAKQYAELLLAVRWLKPYEAARAIVLGYFYTEGTFTISELMARIRGVELRADVRRWVRRMTKAGTLVVDGKDPKGLNIYTLSLSGIQAYRALITLAYDNEMGFDGDEEGILDILHGEAITEAAYRQPKVESIEVDLPWYAGQPVIISGQYVGTEPR